MEPEGPAESFRALYNPRSTPAPCLGCRGGVSGGGGEQKDCGNMEICGWYPVPTLQASHEQPKLSEAPVTFPACPGARVPGAQGLGLE